MITQDTFDTANKKVDQYAVNPPYVQSPNAANRQQGVEPMDTLPAQWWNFLWREITKAQRNFTNIFQSLYEEVQYVIEQNGGVLSDSDNHQLMDALRTFLAGTIATTTSTGVVKASTDPGKVSVAADGVMTANGLGDNTALTTSAKTSVVAAINEIVSTLATRYTSTTPSGLTAFTGTNSAGTSTAWARADHTHAVSIRSATTSQTGVVQLSDAVNSTSTTLAATANAVKKAYDHATAGIKASVSGTTLVLSSNS